MPLRAFLAAAAAFASVLLVAGTSSSAAAAPPVEPPPPGATLLGFYSWQASGLVASTGRHHAVRWLTLDWDPRNFGETWHDAVATAAAGGWALQATWSTERYDPGLGRPVEAISPGAVARGLGDVAIVAAAHALEQSTRPVILRLNAEMNGHWHSYCAVGQNGEPRDADHTTDRFVAAWRRIRTIFRGPDLATVNERLLALGQPPLAAGPVAAVGAPNVAFAFAPNVSASPPTRENGHDAAAYYPGDDYVDWVGVDVYDYLAGNTDWEFNRALLDAHYVAHPGKPFAFFEWGLRSGTDDARFVNDALDWVELHPRVALIQWYDSAGSQFALNPLSAATYRARVTSPRYLSHWPVAQDTLRPVEAGAPEARSDTSAAPSHDPNGPPPGDSDGGAAQHGTLSTLARVPPGAVVRAGRVARVPVTCPTRSTQPCRGTLRLHVRRSPATTRSRGQLIGVGQYRVEPGKLVYTAVSVSPVFRRLLRRGLRLSAVATAWDSGAARSASTQVLLRTGR
jgi:hypothetical protein